MATIDPTRLTEDLSYAYSVFWHYLSGMPQGPKKQYYYQYSAEVFPIFEELMFNNMIAIEAFSLEEAKVLSAILRVIIDMHVASLDQYLVEASERTGGDYDAPITMEKFFTAIIEGNDLDDYAEYVSETLKPMKDIEVVYVSTTGRGKKAIKTAERIIMDTVKVFNRQLIMNIIHPNKVPITTVDQVRDLLGAKSQHPRLSATKQAQQQQEEEED